MATSVQRKRGTAAQVLAFLGLSGELVIDSTNNRLVVHDGATTGGFPVAKLSEVATLVSNNFTGAQNTARATVASAATTANIWSAAGNQINWTGTAICTGFPAAPQAGAERVLICAGAATFTASADMLIDGVSSGTVIVCATNDKVIVRAISTTQFMLTRVISGPPNISSYTYANRNSLRTVPATEGNAVIIESLGLFLWQSDSTELDDDETCFATASGRWLLQAVSYDLVDSLVNAAVSALDPLPIMYFGRTPNTVISVGGNTGVSINVIVPGCVVGMPAIAAPPGPLSNPNGTITAQVTSNNVVTIHVGCVSASGVSLPAGEWFVAVFDTQQFV